MASAFRPTTPADGPELVGLAQRLLGVTPGNPMFAEQHLRWKYWEPWGGSNLPRSHVLVRDERIVAHAGVLPLTARFRDKEVRLLHPFDWMSEPRAIGSGAALLQRLAKLADGLLIVGGSESTQRMVRPLGFRALGDVFRYAAPAQAEPSAAGADLASSAALTVIRAPRLTVQECERSLAPTPWLTFAREPDLLQAFASCPAAPMLTYVVRNPSSTIGGFVLARAPRQARIAAFWTTPESQLDLAALVGLARHAAVVQAGEEIDEVVCMASSPTDRAALVAAGFQLVGHVPSFLLTTSRDLAESIEIGFQMLDGDVAFLHHGAPERWR